MMKPLPSQDYFPDDAPIAAFTDRLLQKRNADVFSEEHLLATRLLLSNSFPGKSTGFLLVWFVVDAVKWLAFRKQQVFSCLFVDNSPRIRKVNLGTAATLAEGRSVAWMTSPARRKKSVKGSGVVGQDVVWSLGLSGGPSIAFIQRSIAFFRETRRLNPLLAKELNVSKDLGVMDCWMHAVLLARAEDYCARHQVGTVVLASDTEHFGIALAWAAHRRGSRVLVLQHGTLNPHNCFGVASHLFCWTDSIRDYALRTTEPLNRMPALEVHVVGGIHSIEKIPEGADPVGDCLFLDQLSAHGLRMWGRQWVGETRQWLAALAEELPGKDLRIRCHPSLKGADAEVPPGWYLSEEPDLMREMGRCKIILTMNSTAGLEAGAMGKSVIFLWNEKMVWLDSMSDLSDLVVTSKEELLLRIRELLFSSEAMKNYAAKCEQLCRKHLGNPETTVGCMARMIAAEGEG